MLISAAELVERTGITYRQLDYWCTAELIIPANQKNNPGSGHYRKFDENIVERVKLLVRMSSIFSRFDRLKNFKQIDENFERGWVDLGEGIILRWGAHEYETESIMWSGE